MHISVCRVYTWCVQHSENEKNDVKTQCRVCPHLIYHWTHVFVCENVNVREWILCNSCSEWNGIIRMGVGEETRDIEHVKINRILCACERTFTKIYWVCVCVCLRICVCTVNWTAREWHEITNVSTCTKRVEMDPVKKHFQFIDTDQWILTPQHIQYKMHGRISMAFPDFI